MRQDEVALALIEARLAAARERRIVIQIRRERHQGRRARRPPGLRWWGRCVVTDPAAHPTAAHGWVCG
jgi:hypothetical protein